MESPCGASWRLSENQEGRLKVSQVLIEDTVNLFSVDMYCRLKTVCHCPTRYHSGCDPNSILKLTSEPTISLPPYSPFRHRYATSL